MDSTSDNPDFLTSLVLDLYSSLRFQPPPQQYTILAAFILSCTPSETFKVISFATGSKCLPFTRLSRHGDSLNDSHAEILARRGALRWFLEEVQRVHSTEPSYESPWIIQLHSGKYRLRDPVRLYMYISTLPCGDASTRFVALHQDEEIALLKDSMPFPNQDAGKAWRGRNDYHSYGVLRTKPGRADSPPTSSMSCSDKIASWNVLGIQGALGAHIFMPLYPHSIIIGEIEEHMQDVFQQDCERAFWGRINELKGLPDGYSVNRPAIRFTSLSFMHSRTSLSKVHALAGSCNDSLCWIADSIHKYQVLINGVKRGVPPKHKHNPKFRPVLSKLALFQAQFFHLTPGASLKFPDDRVVTYQHFKEMAKDYQRAKNVLLSTNTFIAWSRNGIEWKSFDMNGNVDDTRAELPNDKTNEFRIDMPLQDQVCGFRSI